MEISDSCSYELRIRWNRSDAGMAVFGLGALCFAGWGVSADGLETGLGIGVIAFVTVFGVLVLLAATASFHGPRARLRVDASGVGFARGLWRRRAYYDVIGWQDVEAFVTWKGKQHYWVGVAASEAYRRSHGLGRGRFNAWYDKTLGLPVSGTVRAWDGPEEDIQALHEAVAALAPHVPCVDPTDARPSDDLRDPS